MEDEARKKRIMFMLELWWHLKKTGTVWTNVSNWLEKQLNDELPLIEHALSPRYPGDPDV